MIKFKIILVLALVLAFTIPQQSVACFDTYLFLSKGGMTLPSGTLTAEINGEYRIDEGKFPRDSENLVFNYGLNERLTLKLGLVSEEKSLLAFGFEIAEFQATYSLVRNYKSVYNLDVILQHHTTIDGYEPGLELSAPNIWHFERSVIVAHPVLNLEKGGFPQLRGHAGIFSSFNNRFLLGVGAEFESSQTDYGMKERLVNSEFATSIFAGTMIGSRFYCQSEFIKGLNEGDDYAFALTLKFVVR